MELKRICKCRYGVSYKAFNRTAYGIETLELNSVCGGTPIF